MESKDGTPMVELVPVEPLSLDKMELTDRIELLNALRSVRDKLPKLKTSPQIERYIYRQYLDWVDQNIKVVLGESKKSDVFSDQEIQILKALASKVQQKQDTPQVSKAQPLIQNDQPQTKLKEGIDVAKYRKSQEDFLRELEAMDRNSPQF